MVDLPDTQNKSQDPEAELERHVDELMDPKIPDLPQAPKDAKTGTADTKTDIFEDAKPAAKAPAIDEKIAEDPTVDSSDIDPLVDDIVVKEGDSLLAVQDNEVAKAFDNHAPTFKERVTNFFQAWWDNKLARYGSFTTLAVLLLVAGTIPGSRYFMLNTAGVRADASLTILDSTTDLPLKNVDVTVGGQSGRTNQDGIVRLSSLKLGSQPMTISQLGFAEVTRTVTLGLGSNPLGEVELRAVGAQYTFKLTDYVSGKPMKNAEATSGDANAQSDDKGEVILTLGSVKSPKITVELKAAGYRTEKITVDTTTKQSINAVMVIDRKEVFVSKQSGKYDVYSIDVDGKNRKLLLAGTGLERPQMTVVPHGPEGLVAVVSSRENKRNQDGYLLDTLTIINTKDGSVLTLDNSERIQVVDWFFERLVYVKVKAGTSAGNPERNQLMSYDFDTTKRLQLAAANSFVDVVSAKGVLYYAASNGYQGGQSHFSKVNPDGSGKQTLLNGDIWNIMRSSYDEMYLAGSYTGNKQNWYSYRLGDFVAKKLSQAPSNQNETKYYQDIPGGKLSLWTESMDGKGVLLVHETATNKDTVLATKSGLTYPLRWIDGRTAIFRVVTPTETASYIVSLGSEPRKITDVTNVSGLARWNYGY